jgi:hypothetical protein
LVELLGLDSVVAVDKRAGRLNLAASGSIDGGLAVDAKVLAGGLDLSTSGTLRMTGSDGPTPGLRSRSRRQSALTAITRGRRPPKCCPPLTGRLAYAGGAIGLTELTGKLAGTDVSGRLKIASRNRRASTATSSRRTQPAGGARRCHRGAASRQPARLAGRAVRPRPARRLQ